ncbi:transcriptional regulator [candidate division Kazan bacterium]|uniref:Transcriptional regulator n=1 Tax=candidate division Kazan bacterium TaxID=2202143 RepID=A0A420ZD60_UNCK3|nr:MAG: transcriptional regulator [candidate division Kazan bacterium]
MVFEDITETFKALSDPTRQDILMRLRRRRMTPGKLATYFDISKPSLSHHLAILHRANLIDSERVGQKIYYSFNATVFYEIMNKFINSLKK